MYGILETIESILPNKYNIYIGDTPKDIDCLVITDIPGVQSRRSLRPGLGAISREVKLWIRQTPYKDVYTDLENDLYSYYETIRSYVNKSIGDKFITQVRNPRILSLGRDENEKLIFSLTFNIIYTNTTKTEGDS